MPWEKFHVTKVRGATWWPQPVLTKDIKFHATRRSQEGAPIWWQGTYLWHGLGSPWAALVSSAGPSLSWETAASVPSG